ncbi:N-acetyltransferase [Legionella sp. PATHC032]|uniref:GNAT family N-acetyltransferase n=1 Tax=Legionella sp. PATHC032 TaxID=2992039 RepID=UPI001AFD93FD|nr:GNAT family N-acetyltransferase [Legionella sp. PATHC032]MCW8420071.1 N-acetyltransferase [Legionella sp. PATHC032]HAZ7574654.1 N-acetyltransferase [Legionella pneumophila]HBA1635396.1 N-acetyltransferase [Legionella pneumophila]
MLNKLTWLTGKAQEDWIEKILHLRQKIWPDYQRIKKDHILKLYSHYPLYQWLSHYNGEVVAIINSLPVAFHQSLDNLPQEGLNWILSHLEFTIPNPPNYLAAVSVTVNPAYQRLGLSKLLLNRLKASAQEAQYNALIVPARPSQKENYPLISIEDYLKWKKADNTIFDPWLRVHAQLGGKIAHPCQQSRMITANVAQWEQWLGHPLLQTGQYLVKSGLNPVIINKEEDVGIYIEANVWVIHDL